MQDDMEGNLEPQIEFRTVFPILLLSLTVMAGLTANPSTLQFLFAFLEP
jgi:hypothetical protein